MTTILVGVDATAQSDDAVSLARDLAVPARSRIVLATAVPYPAAPFADGAVFAYIDDDLPAVARNRLAALAEPLRAGGLAVETFASGYASAPQRLQDLAEREHADVVVVGSTHAGRWGRVLPGSTGERLLHGAPCAVAVAPIGYRSRDEPPMRRVGVAFDGSAESRAALEAGVTMASRSAGQLEVVAVVDAAGFGSPALMGGPGYDRIRTDLVSRAREHLDVVIDRLPATLRPTGRLLAGDPAERLASHSEDIDVLLLGSRRYGPLRAVLLGGVSGRVIRHAACPVVVVPRGVEHPLSALGGAPARMSAGT